MTNAKLFGPFESPDDISKYWYQVTEKELGKYIQLVNEDLEDPDLTKEDIESCKQYLNNLSQELENLRSFVGEYTRCVERFKFNKNVLRQIEDDWAEYNLSLYSDYARTQSMMLNSDLTRGVRLKEVQAKSRSERIKREEIERRIRDHLAE